MKTYVETREKDLFPDTVSLDLFGNPIEEKSGDTPVKNIQDDTVWKCRTLIQQESQQGELALHDTLIN